MTTRTDDYQRQHGHSTARDHRLPGQKDRDRVLYTEEFRRLAGITQVLTPTGHAFHNRLTHTLEVAQVARRIAEHLHHTERLGPHPHRAERIDPDVVEAAALIHDLGHPPFGHLGEHELDRLARQAGDPDGFEGNAQSFRIVTRLAGQSSDYPGLNLTRATLNASLKYANLRAPAPDPLDPDAGQQRKQFEKFGAYRDDEAAFAFARSGQTHSRAALEAQIMDHADDVAYSTQDLSDFYRSGMLPLHHLTDPAAWAAFFEKHKPHFLTGASSAEETRISAQLREVLLDLDHTPGYDGSHQDLLNIRARISEKIGQFVQVSVNWDDPDGPALVVPDSTRLTITLFKRLIWEYVICHSSVTGERERHRAVITFLFGHTLQTVQAGPSALRGSLLADFVPPLLLDRALQPSGAQDVRLAVDIVASLSDAQAETLYARLTPIPKDAR